jgi:cell division protein FtsQ
VSRAAGGGARESTRAAPRRGRWILPVLMAIVTAAVLAVYYTPVLGVRTVDVSGTATLPQQEVLAAAGIPIGQPMLQVSPATIRERLQAVAKVASARVWLEWPATVHLDVTERVPVAFVVAANELQLVDGADVVFTTVPVAPPGLPELHARPGDPAGHAAVTVLAGLPPTLSVQVASVAAPTPNDIRLMLKDGREVDWGDPSDSARKAAILPPLLTQSGKVFDVRSPGLATIAG